MKINVLEAKNRLSELIRAAQSGEDIVIAKSGKPVARLVPFAEERTPRKPGRWKGKVVIADDFDATPGWLVGAFEGETGES